MMVCVCVCVCSKGEESSRELARAAWDQGLQFNEVTENEMRWSWVLSPCFLGGSINHLRMDSRSSLCDISLEGARTHTHRSGACDRLAKSGVDISFLSPLICLKENIAGSITAAFYCTGLGYTQPWVTPHCSREANCDPHKHTHSHIHTLHKCMHIQTHTPGINID